MYLAKDSEYGKLILGDYDVTPLQDKNLIRIKPIEPLDIEHKLFKGLIEEIKNLGAAAVFFPQGKMEITAPKNDVDLILSIVIKTFYSMMIHEEDFVELIPGCYMLNSDDALMQISKDPEAMGALDAALRNILGLRKIVMVSTPLTTDLEEYITCRQTR